MDDKEDFISVPVVELQQHLQSLLEAFASENQKSLEIHQKFQKTPWLSAARTMDDAMLAGAVIHGVMEGKYRASPYGYSFADYLNEKSEGLAQIVLSGKKAVNSYNYDIKITNGVAENTARVNKIPRPKVGLLWAIIGAATIHQTGAQGMKMVGVIAGAAALALLHAGIVVWKRFEKENSAYLNAAALCSGINNAPKLVKQYKSGKAPPALKHRIESAIERFKWKESLDEDQLSKMNDTVRSYNELRTSLGDALKMLYNVPMVSRENVARMQISVPKNWKEMDLGGIYKHLRYERVEKLFEGVRPWPHGPGGQ